MQSKISRFGFLLLCVVALAGCAAQTATTPPSMAGEPSNATNSDPSTPAVDAALESNTGPMVFGWVTGFSGFISAPIDVRREAHSACNERGYAVAVMAKLAIVGDNATAEFTCRGDAEQ